MDRASDSGNQIAEPVPWALYSCLVSGEASWVNQITDIKGPVLSL